MTRGPKPGPIFIFILYFFDYLCNMEDNRHSGQKKECIPVLFHQLSLPL